ncbi:MAG: DPP IV N-terminal domain-containing protein [Flavobacteriales bacterium]
MIHVRNLALLALLVIPFAGNGQEKLKTLTLSDAVLKSGTDLAPQRLKGLQWIPGTSSYCYLKNDTLWAGVGGKRADMPIAMLADLNAGLPEEAQLKRFPGIEWEGSTQFSFMHNDRVYLWDRKDNKLSERLRMLPEATNQDMDGKQHQVAYTVGQNLYIARPGEKDNIVVTKDTVDGIVNGQSVHRQEYGIVKGTFWSPDGNALAFYRMDESMVTPYFVESIGTKPSTFNKLRYPMAGQTSHQVKLGIFDMRTRSTHYLSTGEPVDQYLTNIAWDPDGQFAYITHLNRAADHLRLIQYDVKTGAPVKTLLEEKNDKWLEPEHPARFLEKNKGKYIWWSERDGRQHLYLYDLKNGLVRQLTKGDWTVTEILGTDEKEEYVYVQGTTEDVAPTLPPVVGDMRTPVIMTGGRMGSCETHLYRVELATGTATRITNEVGTHQCQLEGDFVIDAWSSTAVPGRTDMRDASTGQVVKTMVDSSDPYAGYRVGTVELFTIPGSNSDRLNARLIKPYGFDPGKKYPVIVYVYNGPHVQLVTNSFLGGASPWMLEAAERGYLVFTVDGHGSENRGLAFEQTVHRRLGTVEVEDQAAGAEYLKKLPYVDADRMAVHGWSFGGFMTVSLMLKKPGLFKVGVAGGPVMDWAMYEVMYTERYMDTPQENPEGYATSALTDKAELLQGNLLIIHGTMDDTVLREHSLTFLKNCVDKGVQVEYFEYPGHAHNVRGKDRLHLMTKVLDHIDAQLGVKK